MEVSFPRGGREKLKSTAEKPLKRKQDDDLFGNVLAKKNSKKSKEAKNKSDKKAEGLEFNLKPSIVDPLTYKVLSEGMLVLGCIQEIHRYHMMVSLPGRTSGRVPITAISKPYSKVLSGTDDVLMLNELFHVGEHVVCRVSSIAVDGNYHQVSLTLDPEEVHSELTHSSVKKGMVLTGALSSVEDHGYLMDFGIPALTAFLKKENAQKLLEQTHLKEFCIGQLIRCVVTKAKNSVASTTVQVSADPELVAETLIETSCGVNPHLVVPGMRFKVSSLTPMTNGAAIRWLHFDGYVHSDHLPDASKPLEVQFKDEECMTATVLYTLPLVRTVYLSMQRPAPFTSTSSLLEEAQGLRPGEIVENAEVVSASFRGVQLRLKKGCAGGFVHSSQMPQFGVDDDPRLKYPPGQRVQCRVLKFHNMDRVFLCTLKKEKINEKVLVAGDLEAGTVVNCVVTEVRKKDVLVEINKWHHLKARVPSLHLSDAPVSDLAKRFPPGHLARGRVLFVDLEKNVVNVTLKPSLVQSKKPIVSSYDNIPSDQFFEGVVVCVQPKFYLVSFFNDVTGKLSRSAIPAEVGSNFSLGQTIHVRVHRSFPQAAKLSLSMLDHSEQVQATRFDFEVGREYSAEVVEAQDKEVQLKIKGKETEGAGVVPLPLVSMHKSLQEAVLGTLSPGAKVKATCLLTSRTRNVFTLDQEVARILRVCVDDDLKVNALLPGLVKTIGKTGVFLSTYSKKCGIKTVFVPQKSLADQPVEDMRKSVVENQALLCRIECLPTEKTEKTFKVPLDAIGHTKLMDVCPYGILSGGSESVLNYLKAYTKVFKQLKKDKHPLVTFEPGQMIKGVVDEVSRNEAKLKLDSGVEGIISSYHSQSTTLKVGQEVNAIVIWVDVGSKSVHLSIRPDILKQVHRDQASCEKPKVDSSHRGEVIHMNEDVVVVLLKGQCRGLVACAPASNHPNDLTPQTYHLGQQCKFNFLQSEEMLPGCVNKRHVPNQNKKLKVHPDSFERWIQQKSTKDAEVKEESEDEEMQELEAVYIKTVDEIKEEPKEEMDQEVPTKAAKKKNKKKSDKVETLSVPAFVWDPDTIKDEDQESSSDEDEPEESGKKKLSRAEQRALARQQEEGVSKAELKLANEANAPQSADEFDRLLLAAPDSSIVWVQYMAFHLQATEIEKARGVARKALKTISFREEQEKLNVWVALLNLENLYGAPDTLEKTLQEAVQLNDAQKVYAQMLKIFADTNKVEEGNALFETILRKFRSDKETWVQGGTYFFQTSQLEKGRHLLQRALKSLDKKHHVDVICRFAQLENRLGSAERCQTLFEHVVSGHPRRVDVWSAYADALLKAGHVDACRRLLERACALPRLPPARAKVLFNKFVQFETQHGSPADVDAVREKARLFVQNAAPKGSDSE